MRQRGSLLLGGWSGFVKYPPTVPAAIRLRNLRAGAGKIAC